MSRVFNSRERIRQKPYSRSNERARWAFLQSPRLGGTYSVFRSLRPALAEYGVDLRWVGLASPDGKDLPAELRSETQWGTFIGSDQNGELHHASALYTHLTDGSYNGVFVNVLCGAIETNLARYLPAYLPRVLIVHSITRGTYLAARAVRDHVNHTIAVSPRIRNSLVGRYGFRPNSTTVIPNAVSTTAPTEGADPRSRIKGRIEILYLGRIEDSSKGVLMLPPIVRSLAGCDWRLTVAGDGPDLPKLKERLSGWSANVTFLGGVGPKQVWDLLRQHDVLLMPSRYEGFGITLIEAMAAGCVPVVSRIREVTDWIVNEGETGFLFRVGDTRAAANKIRTLALEPRTRLKVGQNAQRSVLSRFRAEVIAREYVNILEEVAITPTPLKAPLHLDQWRLARELRPGLRTMLPEPIKNRLRTLREQLAR